VLTTADHAVLPSVQRDHVIGMGGRSLGAAFPERSNVAFNNAGEYREVRLPELINGGRRFNEPSRCGFAQQSQCAGHPQTATCSNGAPISRQ